MADDKANKKKIVVEDDEPGFNREGNIKFVVEMANTASVNPHVATMLTREAMNLFTMFSREWLHNIERIKEMGFDILDEGDLICVKKHYKREIYNLGKFTQFATLQQVANAVMQHNAEATHIDEEAEQEPLHRPRINGKRGRAGCTPDCPPHAHSHYRKIIGD